MINCYSTLFDLLFFITIHKVLKGIDNLLNFFSGFSMGFLCSFLLKLKFIATRKLSYSSSFSVSSSPCPLKVVSANTFLFRAFRTRK